MLRIIELAPQSNGAHANQTINEIAWDGGEIPDWIPDGWGIIPDEVEIPDTFPFVGVEAEGRIITALTPGEVPPPGPEPEQTYSAEDLMSALLGG